MLLSVALEDTQIRDRYLIRWMLESDYLYLTTKIKKGIPAHYVWFKAFLLRALRANHLDARFLFDQFWRQCLDTA